jgi:hypothetical protein
MPFSTDALKGLATILNLIANKRGGGTVQEIQCLWMDGWDILAAGNSTKEANVLATGLTNVGAKPDQTLSESEELRSVFTAIYADSRLFNESGERVPTPESNKLAAALSASHAQPVKVWQKDFYRPGMQELGTACNWLTGDGTLQAALKQTKSSGKKLKEEIGNDPTFKDCERGIKLLGKGDKEKESKVNPWSLRNVGGTTFLLPTSGKSYLVLISSNKGRNSAGSEVELDMHAEQSLLYAFALHLKNGGNAGPVHIAGKKKTCHVCSRVFKAFAQAYQDAYGCVLAYDQNTVQPTESSNESGVLNLPLESGVSVNYGKLVESYTAARNEAFKFT